MSTPRRRPPNHAAERIENARDAIMKANSHLQCAITVADECAEHEHPDAWRTLASMATKVATALRLTGHAKSELEAIEGIEPLPDRDAIHLVHKRKTG